MLKAAQESVTEKILLKSWRPYVWISLLVILVYFKTASFGFSHFDDDKLIVDNHTFISNIANFPRLFAENVFHDKASGDYYRPLLAVSLMLDSQISGIAPFMYHITNILVHLAACLLLFRLFLKLGYRNEVSFFFTLLFAVHPALAQAVAWIPGRNDSLLAVFIIAAFIFFLDFIKAHSRRYYLYHIIFFLAALLTKETALMLVPVCFLYLVIINKERFFSFNQRALACGWGIVIAFWFFARHIALPAQAGAPPAGLIIENAFKNLPALIQFIGKAILPFNLSVMPVMQDTTFLYGFVAIILLVLTLMSARRKNLRFILFGALWFFLFLAPSFVRPNPTITADFLEHRIYLPIIGLALMLFESDIVKNFTLKKSSCLIFCILLVLLFSILTLLHSENFKDPLAFWSNAIKTSPSSSVAHTNLGSVYQIRGEYDKSQEEFGKALSFDANQPIALSDLAGIYLEKNMLGEAREKIEKAVALSPNYDEANYILAKLYYKEGKIAESETTLKKAIEINPEYFAAYAALGIIYMQQNNLAAAEEEFRKACAINQFHADTIFNLGLVCFRQGKEEEGQRLWLKALSVNPEHIDAELNLAVYYFNKKDFPKAKYYFSRLQQKGIKIDSQVAQQLGL